MALNEKESSLCKIISRGLKAGAERSNSDDSLSDEHEVLPCENPLHSGDSASPASEGSDKVPSSGSDGSPKLAVVVRKAPVTDLGRVGGRQSRRESHYGRFTPSGSSIAEDFPVKIR